MSPAPTLETLQELARGAGRILLDGYGQQHQVGYKGPVDLVTEVDRRSEAYLLGEIRSAFPGDAIIAEESGSHAGSSSRRWVIDPLDGTVNYAHSVPVYSVSIAWADEQGVRLGVIYHPPLDECFSAERGRGAWLNGEWIHVSDASSLLGSLLVTGFPYDMLTTEHHNLDHFSRLSRITQGVRRLGSAALDLAYVACGRFDGYWELKLAAWDMAAGMLLVREAGGVVTDVFGGPDPLAEPHSVLAANPAMHALILEQLRTTPGDYP